MMRTMSTDRSRATGGELLSAAALALALAFGWGGCDGASETVDEVPAADAPVEAASTPAASTEPDRPAPLEDRAGQVRRTIGRMLDAAEAGDWERYVDEFYGESEKLDSDVARDALVARFRDRWGEAVLEALREAVTIEPVFEGPRAFFRDASGETVFELHRRFDGVWTFHL